MQCSHCVLCIAPIRFPLDYISLKTPKIRPGQTRRLQKKFAELVKDKLPAKISVDTVEIWQQDESRIGQQGSLTRIWAKLGTRPRKVKQQQYLNTYIYGAACGETGQACGLVLPLVNTDAMNIFLTELSANINIDKHAALVMDNAGWHIANKLVIPDNITIIPLPAYAPELNAMEQVWRWMKDNYLSNGCYKDYDDIVDKTCEAWISFANNKSLVKSICARAWLNIP